MQELSTYILLYFILYYLSILMCHEIITKLFTLLIKIILHRLVTMIGATYYIKNRLNSQWFNINNKKLKSQHNTNKGKGSEYGNLDY